MKPAHRLNGTKPSPIRLVSDHAPADAMPLGLGAPTWPMPEPARAALAAIGTEMPYGPNPGRESLRTAIAEFYGAKVDEVLTTCGSQEALFTLFHAWVDPDDTVLIPDPGFPAYPALAQLVGADVATYSLDANNRFRLDPAAVVTALELHPRTKMVIVNPPSNPTGGAATKEALTIVAAACEERGVLLVSDEVYRDLYFDRRPPSLREVTSRGAVVSSVSKGWGSPGLRIGWILGDPLIVNSARLIHNHAVTSAAWSSQLAAEALIRNSATVLADARREVARRFEALASAMKEHLGDTITPPDGTFYHWMKLPEPVAHDPLAFCLKLRDEAKVVLIPGTAFGPSGRGHVRLSFAATPEQIKEGVRRFAPHFADALATKPVRPH